VLSTELEKPTIEVPESDETRRVSANV
jgi:hypothetical protein